MSGVVKEIYQQTVRPLPAQERLELAALILADIALPARSKLTEDERKDAMAELLRFAGTVSSGNKRSADNELIDADLTVEYGKNL